MKLHIKAAAAGIALLCASAATAQTTYSGYFLDNYTYRYQLNPAFAPESGFAGMPAIGNFNLAMRGNLHVSDVVYNVDGKTVLFTNPGVSASEVMSGIKDRNRIGLATKFDLLSAGWKAWGGFNAITVSAVANANISIPKAFFSLAKEGVENRTYDIRDMFGNANAYAQIALNHSRDIKQVPGLRAGAALKFYVGVGNLDFQFNRADLTLGTESWRAVTNANVYASVGGLKFDHKTNDKSGREYVSGANIDGFGINGFGMGLDLGAEYKWNDFRFSVAVLDLGFISWGKTQWASTDGDRTIDTGAYTFNADDDAPNSFSNEWDRLSDDLAELYQLSDMGELSSRTRAMAATLNFGVEYEFPLYRKLRFGVLNSTVINGKYTWNQTRISANVSPLRFLSASVNMEAGSYGVGFGWLLNIYTKGINFFAGMDHTLGKLAKPGVPLNSNASFNVGLNFPF